MKTSSLLLTAAALFAGGCQSASPTAPHAAASDITVVFSQPDKFTDVRETSGGATSQYYLDLLSQHLKEVVSLRLRAGEKLTVTFTDIDLAGEFQPDLPRLQDVRIIKSIYAPRMVLSFQLRDAASALIREGQHTLTDSAFDQDISIAGRDEPLFYDKILLDHWINREFGARRSSRLSLSFAADLDSESDHTPAHSRSR